MKMTIAEKVADVLSEVDRGPWHWADFDLILMYLNDTYGYEPKSIPTIKRELNKQAYRHRLILSETKKTVIYVWATRKDIKTTDILQEYLELEYHD